MGRMLKVGAGALAVVLYVWFAAVKNVDVVKERKQSRERDLTR